MTSPSPPRGHCPTPGVTAGPPASGVIEFSASGAIPLKAPSIQDPGATFSNISPLFTADISDVHAPDSNKNLIQQFSTAVQIISENDDSFSSIKKKKKTRAKNIYYFQVFINLN